MALKPMNCPAHVLIFKPGHQSYRDLPLRIYENGCCHRNEPHGALHGLMRVRQFTQDDAHIFCREDQIVEEVRAFCDAGSTASTRTFGFTYAIKLALRPEKRFGTEEMWDQAEHRTARRGCRRGPRHRGIRLGGTARRRRVLCAQAGIPPDRRDRPHLAGRHDPVGPRAARTARCRLYRRRWRKHRPVMLHRAIFGTYRTLHRHPDRALAGKLPVWLAPVQAVVATIVSDADGYARDVEAKLKAAGIRVETDLRNEKINYKVREHSLAKVPHLLVVGKREAEEGTVAIRTLGEERQKFVTLDEAIALLKSEATPPDLR
jgi:threonyl-tRNA synthetase